VCVYIRLVELGCGYPLGPCLCMMKWHTILLRHWSSIPLNTQTISTQEAFSTILRCRSCDLLDYQV